MKNLPADLLLRICESLCRHCQSPDAFPHAEIWAIREDKGALASLAATSSGCRAFAQPVFFGGRGETRTLSYIYNDLGTSTHPGPSLLLSLLCRAR